MADGLARIRALPIWSAPAEPLPLHGGLSNQSYTVEDAGKKFVVRLGRDYVFHHVIRERELMTARAAHAGGFAPEVVHAEPGLTVSRFIAGKPFSEADMRAKIPNVAAIVRRFHDEMPRHVSGPGFIFWPFHVIRDYALTLSAGGSAFAGELPGWLALAEELEAAQVALPIVFGHHDFLPANIIDDGDRLWMIDFEYAGFGTAMFDLAGIASNAEFSADESDALLSHYFDRRPSPSIRRAHAAMQCASLLREAMWGMVSDLHLDNPGIDYAAYARMNLERLAAALEAYRTRYGKET
jgi:thiamine kinase-like enzyme